MKPNMPIWKTEQGMIFALATILMVVLLALGIALGAFLWVQHSSFIRTAGGTKALYYAESGVEHVLVKQLKYVEDWRSLANNTLLQDYPFADGYYTVIVESAQEDQLFLHAIGKYDNWSRDLWVTVKRDKDTSPDSIWFTDWRDQLVENLLGE